ncbi:hypothetical protein TRICI_006106 [Trichomonascus ciferrii]|uniref:mRNA stability protein n=1 Tax=Trichomonascus ciferrii TaxID=44093 RepID=A0A642ULW7_9ASCO|nr:hypothetical protein TRICI_006106 [Trichomonascus ciferrii]
MYGRLPSRKDLLSKKLSDRKYFDSGDYALRQAGRQTDSLPKEIAQNHLQPNTSPPLGGGAQPSLSSSPPSAHCSLHTGLTPTSNPPGTVPIVSHRKSESREASSLQN